MDIDPQLAQLGMSLADVATRRTAQFVNDRISALRAAKRNEETIAGLEELVNDLIADKNELVRIAQAYEAELVAQQLSADDVEYITANVVPVLKQLAGATGGEQIDATMKVLEPLLSVETVNIVQLLGFNFRKALGEPLTELARRAILSRAQSDPATSAELQSLIARQNLVYFEIAKDPEAFARLERMKGL